MALACPSAEVTYTPAEIGPSHLRQRGARRGGEGRALACDHPLHRSTCIYGIRAQRSRCQVRVPRGVSLAPPFEDVREERYAIFAALRGQGDVEGGRGGRS